MPPALIPAGGRGIEPAAPLGAHRVRLRRTCSGRDNFRELSAAMNSNAREQARRKITINIGRELSPAEPVAMERGLDESSQARVRSSPNGGRLPSLL